MHEVFTLDILMGDIAYIKGEKAYLCFFPLIIYGLYLTMYKKLCAMYHEMYFIQDVVFDC